MSMPPPEMEIQPARGGFWRNLSPVWLVPVLAIGVSGWIGWRSYADRGVLIEIAFPGAAGVVPGETTVRLREVQVGLVESVTFTPDLSQVVVAARIDRPVAELIPPEAEFWVVRPEVSARGITGLDTVLSGVYVEAAFLPGADGGARSFTGRDSAPLITPGREGLRITLRMADGNRLTPGAPVLHRGIVVGHIEAPALAEGAEGVTVDAFIDAPHDRRITSATRFWDTSGFNFTLGPGGARLGVGNLASILTGGIAFDEVQSGGAPVGTGAVFELFPDETAARRSLTAMEAGESLRLAVEFDESVQGLTVGAEVRYRGVQVGEVAGIAARLVDMGPAPLVRMQALMVLDPRAFGLEADEGPDGLERFIASQVAAGLRARLTPTGLFSTSLAIELVDLPEAPPETLLRPETGAAVIPSAPSDLQDLTTSAQGLIERITSLPIEELLEQAVGTMAAVEALLADPDTRAVPGAATAVLAEAQGLLAAPELQALPAELQAILADLRGITAEFAAAGAAERLIATLDSAQAVADGVAEATGEVPELLSDLRALVRRAGSLELEALLEGATSLVANADALLGAEDTRAIPPALRGTLAEVEGATAELRSILSELAAANAAERLLAALDSAQSVAENVAEATTEMPALVTDLRALAQRAGALELEALLEGATSLVANADALLAAEDTQAIPPALRGTLAEVEGATAELRSILSELAAANAAERLLAALDSAQSVAENVAEATTEMPALVTDLRALTRRAGALELEALLEGATSLVANADTLLGAEETQAIPPALRGALAEVEGATAELRGILSEFGAAQGTQRLIATLESAQAVADGLAEATGEVPELVSDLRALTGRAAALDLEALVTGATELVASAEALISDEGTRALPPALTRALDEVQGALAELREGGVVDNVNRTLAAAGSAADAIAEATQELPALAQRLDRLVVQAEGLVAAYGARSPINEEALATLRDARAAARAFAQLARALERNPNSLLFGR